MIIHIPYQIYRQNSLASALIGVSYMLANNIGEKTTGGRSVVLLFLFWILNEK